MHYTGLLKTKLLMNKIKTLIAPAALIMMAVRAGPVACAACWTAGLPTCFALGPGAPACIAALEIACTAALAAPTP